MSALLFERDEQMWVITYLMLVLGKAVSHVLFEHYLFSS